MRERWDGERSLGALYHIKRGAPDGEFLADLREVMSAIVELPESDLFAPTRREIEIARRRHIAMYLLAINEGLGMSPVGRIFRRDRTSVGHAIRKIEDLRDDTAFDGLLDLLGDALRARLTAMHIAPAASRHADRESLAFAAAIGARLKGLEAERRTKVLAGIRDRDLDFRIGVVRKALSNAHSSRGKA